MRYVAIDSEGASREYFDDLEDVADWLDAVEAKYPGVSEEFLVGTYTDDWQKHGRPSRANDIRRALGRLGEPFIPNPFKGGRVGPVRLKGDRLQTVTTEAFSWADWRRSSAQTSVPLGARSGTATSIPDASFHRHEAATRTPSLLQAGRAGVAPQMLPEPVT